MLYYFVLLNLNHVFTFKELLSTQILIKYFSFYMGNYLTHNY